INPALPAGLDPIILRAMEKDQNLRYQRASNLRADLQELKRGTEPARLPVAVKSEAPTRVGKRRMLAGVVATAVVALSGVGYFYLHRTGKLTDKDTVVLAASENRRGVWLFVGPLRQGRPFHFEQSLFLTFVPEGRVHKPLGLRGGPADARLTPEV